MQPRSHYKTVAMVKHLQQKEGPLPSFEDDKNPSNIDIGASTVRRNPSRRARPGMHGATSVKNIDGPISTKSSSAPIPFHIGELVKQEMPPSKKSETAAEASENIRVFLRIRPLNVKGRGAVKNADKIGGIRGKGVLAKKDEKCTKKKSRNQETCLVVNSTNSVTLTPPTTFLAGAKRAKCEVYDGFSHVFSPESLQSEVYKMVMGPLIRDFMEGKNGLLAAMGPTGSGKTHTMFGTPREPGLVPLALQQLFSDDTKTDCSFAARPYYLSMFEICSTQGKSERIFDLSIGGLDLSSQQSTIDGLQEVMVSSITEAECVIARGMLKRATAVTDANDQSSRSQCIINIRHAPKSSHHNRDKLSTAVFTIVDLAGAERERRTGVLGSRLAESNFINNTSMIFGLCLRSLLEHQKNRKRPLQKHFQNSQLLSNMLDRLTKYLRDYLEGKKRMTLIITAKPGEEDYLNTSFLLRQASPYMKIKFTTEEFPDAPNLKRSIVSSNRLDLAKRRKHNDSKADRIKKNESPTLIKEADAKGGEDTTIPDPSVLCSDLVGNYSSVISCDEEHHTDIQRLKREYHVMNCFMRALWYVLKEHKQKVEVSDDEVRRLKESLRNERTQNILLNQELKDLWSLCSLHDCSPVHAISVRESDMPSMSCSEMTTMCVGNMSKKVEVDYNDRTEVNKDPKFTSPEKESISESKEKFGKNDAMCLSSSTQLGKGYSELIVTSSTENDMVHHEDTKVSSVSTDLCFHAKNVENKLNEEEVIVETEDFVISDLDFTSNNIKMDADHQMILPTLGKQLDSLRNTSRSPVMSIDDLSMQSMQMKLSIAEEKTFSRGGISLVGNVEAVDKAFAKKTPLQVADTISRDPNVDKPKRRLLPPASAMLLKEFSGLDLEDRNAKGKKEAEEGRTKSQGSIGLFQLLQSAKKCS